MRANPTKAFAGILLLVFLAQCLWLIHAELRSESGCYPEGTMARQSRVSEGLAEIRGVRIAGVPDAARSAAAPHQPTLREFDAYRSPLWYLIAAAPVAAGPAPSTPTREALWLWLTRIPYLIFGVLLGASLWYVTRRLYGNAGGLIALVLYSFSPAMVQNTSELCRDSEIGTAWGAFGAIFTAIALAHTLYAPREVILWNWRRIILLGISLALAIGSQFSLVIILPMTLGLFLYLAPERRGAATVIWAAACGIAGVSLSAVYWFHIRVIGQALRNARLVDVTPAAFAMVASYRNAVLFLAHSSPPLVVFLPATVVVCAGWRRARYFGNIAPILAAAVFLGLGIAAPDFPGFGFLLISLPFLFAAVAGVFADLLETRYGSPLRLAIAALLSAYALWSLIALAQV